MKTGVTLKAGPCLASCYMDRKLKVIIILLGCKSMERRFEETELLFNYYKSISGNIFRAIYSKGPLRKF